MRRYGELSRGAERLSPRQFFPDCTIAMCGYDFRERQGVGRSFWKIEIEKGNPFAGRGVALGSSTSCGRGDPDGREALPKGGPCWNARVSPTGPLPEEKRAQSACDELIDKGAIITGE